MNGSDVVVIGAGIIGAAIAFRLAERGLSVRVLEAREAPAMESTGRSAAGVRVQFTSETNVQLSWESIREYRTFGERYGADAGYRDVGYLFLVPPERWSDHLQAVEMQHRLGVPVEVLDPVAAQEIVAFEAEGVAGATFGACDGVVDPHAITQAYLGLARERGARLHLDAEVLRAEPHSEGWTVRTEHEWFGTGLVINAAGAWAGRVAQRAGLHVPVVPARRMIYVSSPLPDPHRYPLTVDVGSGFYLRSEGERVLFGRSNPDDVGFAEGVDWSWLEPTLEPGLARFPWLAEAGLDRRASWWGYYEVTPDHDAILGRMPGADGWINACGFSGHGVQHAAMVGRLVAEEAVEGRAASLDIDPLRIERLSADVGRREANIV